MSTVSLKFAGSALSRHSSTWYSTKRFVSPGYFATMKIPVLSGEFCRGPELMNTPVDATGMHHTDFTTIHVLVNRSFADTHSAGSTVVGHHLRVLDNSFLRPSDAGEVRGIVGDASEEGMNRLPRPTVYCCFGAPGCPDPFYLVRTHAQPLTWLKLRVPRFTTLSVPAPPLILRRSKSTIDEAFAETVYAQSC
jgi:hypothetical protein